MIIHPTWTGLWNISFFIACADTKNRIYSFIEKKNIDLLTNKTFQEKLGFLALFSIEQGSPFQRKLKSMKGKQAETILGRIAGNVSAEGANNYGGPGACPPGNFENLSALRRNLVHFY